MNMIGYTKNSRSPKGLWVFLLCVLAALPLQAKSNEPQGDPDDGGRNTNTNTNIPNLLNPDKGHEARMKWWREARFGLMIHWGLYSIAGGEWKGQSLKKDYAEWLMYNSQVPFKDYSALAKEFNPTKFDPNLWANLAYDAGMRYFVMTTKHHDGFAMFDSKVSDYNVVKATPFARDIYGETVKAFRTSGLHVGAYYSQDLDWSQQQGSRTCYNTWDYPAKDQNTEALFEAYFNSKSLPQVDELCKNYGGIEAFWFDVPRSMNANRGKILLDLIRKSLPNAVINSRIANPQGIYADYKVPGDNGYYTTPQPFDWECPATMDESWGYNIHPKTPKKADDLIWELCVCASAGGNFLLNIGPKPDGTISEPQLDILKKFGVWMKYNAEAIHGTSANPFGEFFNWGFCTIKAGCAFMIVNDWKNGSTITLPRLKNNVTKVEMLGDPARKLVWKKEANDLTVTLNGEALSTAGSVIKVTCEGSTIEADPIQIQESKGGIDLEVRYGKNQGDKMRTLRHFHQDGKALIDLKEGMKNEAIAWDLNLAQPGTFKVVAECVQVDPDERKSKRTVTLDVDEKEVLTTEILVANVKEGKLELGQITVKKSGPATVALHVKGGKSSIHVDRISLQRVP